MPADRTNAERQRRWRERQAGKLAPAARFDCSGCGKVHTGSRGPLCCRCWERLTEEGRAYKRARVAKSRAKAKAAA